MRRLLFGSLTFGSFLVMASGAGCTAVLGDFSLSDETLDASLDSPEPRRDAIAPRRDVELEDSARDVRKPVRDSAPDEDADSSPEDTGLGPDSELDAPPADAPPADAPPKDAPSKDAPTDVQADSPGSCSPPTISGPTSYCPAQTITLTSSAAASYDWSTGGVAQDITVSTAGQYSVITKNASGCVADSATFTVTAAPAPTVPTITTSGATTICPGGSVTLTSSAASAYAWSTGATTSSITVTTAGTYTVTTTDTNGCMATSTAVTVTLEAVTHSSTTFSYMGTAQTFTVPTCITSITVDATGAAGGSSSMGGTGGLGGRVQGTIPVSAGAVLDVYVGGAGQLASSSATNVGGYNGGGTALLGGVDCYGTTVASCSATGGGASDIRTSPYGLANRIVAAGGGGGSGCDNSAPYDNGGAGGGLVGQEGVGGESAYGYEGAGGGGTQSAGGAGATYIVANTCTWPIPSGSGAPGVGGNASCATAASVIDTFGGGGGGGYYGGGAGCAIGGGGGSSYTVGGSSAVTHTQGYQAGNGYVTITW
jgi:hypothetical protein